jgi:hypothetical protein
MPLPTDQRDSLDRKRKSIEVSQDIQSAGIKEQPTAPDPAKKTPEEMAQSPKLFLDDQDCSNS